MGKVNSSDDSSRCLVKSGRIMTGRAMYSSKREEEEKLLQPGHWVTVTSSDSKNNGRDTLFQAKGEQDYIHNPMGDSV